MRLSSQLRRLNIVPLSLTMSDNVSRGPASRHTTLADVVAQKPDRVRRIGVLMPVTAGDAVGLRRAKIFTQALQDLGWKDGQNTRIDYRWPGGDIEQIQSLAKELVGSRPDVLVGVGAAPTTALQQATRTIPVVFTMSTDPVAQGIVERLARPGGNATGFFATEPSLGGKWLELLKEIVPGLRRVGVIFNPETSTGSTSYLHSVETAAPLFSVEATGAPVHHAGDIGRLEAGCARRCRGSANDSFAASDPDNPYRYLRSLTQQNLDLPNPAQLPSSLYLKIRFGRLRPSCSFVIAVKRYSGTSPDSII